MLRDLVASVAAGTGLPNEIVIIVDSNLPLLEALRQRDWPDYVQVLPSTGRGLAAARNAGWRVTTSSRTAFIDDDAVASAHWLEELVATAERHSAEIVGGWIEPRWLDGRPRWFHPVLGWVVGCSYEGLPTATAVVRNVIGCNMLVDRELLERLGGFDESMGRMGANLAGCEETELCIRAGRAGALVVATPGPKVEQILPKPRSSMTHAVRRAWDEGRSKRALVRTHGAVLRTETTYARSLVALAGRTAVLGLRRGRFEQLAQATAMVLVLASTTTSYVVHRFTGPRRSANWRNAASRAGG
jgi:Glycosyl transferase family 2